MHQCVCPQSFHTLARHSLPHVATAPPHVPEHHFSPTSTLPQPQNTARTCFRLLRLLTHIAEGEGLHIIELTQYWFRRDFAILATY